MNYRHSYHAGSFADVFKHIILVALTQAFLRKNTPFCYLDTHAGAGYYDLSAEAAQKNKEFETGINKIISQQNMPELIKDYVACVQKHPEKIKLFYPGSPYVVKQLLRPQDRMILSELHPEEFQSLKKIFGHDKQVSVHLQDGYQSLKAFLPPKERRGFVLIDPPYEQKDEFEKLTSTLSQTIKRWDTGVYAIWYPIKNRSAVNRFLQHIKEKISRPTLIAELSIYPEDMLLSLIGTGMLIINPPWQLDQKLKEILPWLWQSLSVNHQGQFKIETSII